MTWLALQKKDLEATPSWSIGGWGVQERASLSALSDGKGSFEFTTPPAEQLPNGSVVFALHPQYYPGGLDMSTEPAKWPAESNIVLEPATPVLVSVVDPNGRPASGATVHHVIGSRDRSRGETSHAVFGRFLQQSAVTGASGTALLPPFRGQQAFWAEKGELVSIPWQGERPSHVSLALGDSFTVGGTLTVPDWKEWDAEYEGERRILVLARTQDLWRPIAKLRDVKAGNWGPLRLPLDGFEQFAVRLEGAPITPIQESFDRPAPYSNRRIDFVADKQAELYFLVKDENERPISNAKAVVWWGNTDTVASPERVEGASRPDGYLYAGTFPETWVQFRITAPGYALYENGALPPGTIPITLQKGGGVTGRCLLDGKPVPDFEVIYWMQGNVLQHRTESFFDREDGSFEIDSLVPGEWTFHAANPLHPAGSPQTVRIDAEGLAHVELELPVAIHGGGRVVDAQTGEPVSNAFIQAYSSGGMARSFPWGATVPAEQDGTFELDAFVLGSNYLTVEADGYSPADVKASAADTEFLDWGDIRLFRPQPLQITLLGAENLSGILPTELTLGGESAPFLPKVHFGADGTARFENAAPGDQRLFVEYPDASWTRLHLRLDPGKEWNFDHKIAGDRRLAIRVFDENGDQVVSGIVVVVVAQEETGTLVVRMKEPAPDGRRLHEGIRADQVQIWVMTLDSKTLATQDVSFGSNASLEVDVRLGEKPFRVHVVDKKGSPISGAWVTLRSDTSKELLVDDTDLEGWASVLGVKKGPALMDVQHGIAGRCLGVAVDTSVGELEFVLDATATLELQLVDGEAFLEGVTARIETQSGVTLGDAKQTSDEGVVRFESLGEGNYHMSCRRADCWPVFVDERLDPEEHARVTVPMRRLATLELEVRNRDGIPASGVQVGIESSEFEVSLADWLQESKIRATSGLTTDSRGKLRIEGLPNGPYTWSVLVEGQPITGAFRLLPAVENDVLIQLP